VGSGWRFDRDLGRDSEERTSSFLPHRLVCLSLLHGRRKKPFRVSLHFSHYKFSLWNSPCWERPTHILLYILLENKNFHIHSLVQSFTHSVPSSRFLWIFHPISNRDGRKVPSMNWRRRIALTHLVSRHQ
jgi:hypothetical protein